MSKKCLVKRKWVVEPTKLSMILVFIVNTVGEESDAAVWVILTVNHVRNTNTCWYSNPLIRLYPFASNPRRHYIQSFSLSLNKYQRGGFKAVVIIPHNTFSYLSNTLKTTLNITLLRGRRHAWRTHSIFVFYERNYNGSIWKQHYVNFDNKSGHSSVSIVICILNSSY